MEGGHDFLELTVVEWLEELGERRPVPGGGSAAAIAGAMGASLVAMTARLSQASWPESTGIVAQAVRLRVRLSRLARTDAHVYAASLDALARTRGASSERGDYELGKALDRAAQVPLAIAEAACDVVLLAAEAATRGDPRLQADAQAAAALAAASAQAAARLVEVNLGATEGDPRVAKARAVVEGAEAARSRAFAPA